MFGLSFDFMKSIMTTGVMRGLNEFIADIRNCKDRDSEARRVDEQMAKIREKFIHSKSLDGYQRKKYVCKLLYIHILGYEVDFGHEEAAGLIASSVYSEKYIGYVTASVLISEKSTETWERISHFVQSDLNSGVQHNASLALAMVGSLAPQILAKTLAQTVLKMALVSSSSSIYLRKKAMMALLRVFRKYSDSFGDIKAWSSYIVNGFQARLVSLGYTSALVSLLVGVGSIGGAQKFIECQGKVIKCLQKLILNKDCPEDYLYYNSAHPWLQVKLLKALQMWPVPSDPATKTLIEQCLARVICKIDTGKYGSNKSNAQFSVFFEAAHLVFHYGKSMLERNIRNELTATLGQLLTSRDVNLKYLALDTMAKFLSMVGGSFDQHLNHILLALTDEDISIRRRSLDMLFLMASPESAERIVDELISYLESCADFTLKDELVLKIAILAERYARNQVWYIDVVVRLLGTAGEFITDDIWYRIIQLITGFGQYNSDLQHYAAQKLYAVLSLAHVNQNLLKIGAFVLSQFLDQAVSAGKVPDRVVDVIYKHFSGNSAKARKMILNAIAKIGARVPTTSEKVQLLLQAAFQDHDPDVQQRAVQYYVLLSQAHKLAPKILQKNPPYFEEQQQVNPLLKKLAGSKGKSLVESKEQEKLIKLQSMSVGGHALSGHPLYPLAKGRLCHSSPLNLPSITRIPESLCRDLVRHEGQSTGFTFQQNFNKGVGQFLLTILCQGKIEFEVIKSPGLQVAASPVRYGQYPQLIVKAQLTDDIFEPAQAKIKSESGQKTIILPIHVNKFLAGIKITRQKYQQFYQEFSSDNKVYQKIDWFHKVDGSPQEYLKKLGSFMSNVCGLKVQALPNMESMTSLWACGQTFIKGQPIPLLIQSETYPQERNSARVSCRSGSKEVLLGLYELIQEFI